METITIEKLAKKVEKIRHLVIYIRDIEEARQINDHIGDICRKFKEYLTPNYEEQYPLFIRINYSLAIFLQKELDEGIKFYRKNLNGIPIYNIQKKYHYPIKLIKNIDIPVLPKKYLIT